MEIYRNLLTFKENLSNKQSQQILQTKKTEENCDENKEIRPNYMSSLPSSRIKFTITQNDHPETDRIIKDPLTSNDNLFTSPDLLEWQPPSKKNSLANINSIWDIPKTMSNNTSPRFSSCKANQVLPSQNNKF